MLTSVDEKHGDANGDGGQAQHSFSSSALMNLLMVGSLRMFLRSSRQLSGLVLVMDDCM